MIKLNKAVSCSDYTASDDRMIKNNDLERIIGGRGGKRSCLNLRYYLAFAWGD
jgi:hypothetical protein